MKNSIWDKMKGFASPYASDDDYDDLDDEMDDGFPEEEEPAPRYSRRSNYDAAPSSNNFDIPEQKTEPLGDSFSAPAASTTTYNSGSFSSASFSGHVMNGSAGNKQQMVLARPTSFNDISGIAKNLRLKKAVVLNLEGVQHDVARRCVDFLSGCTFAVDGSVKKIADSTYMFCPNNMEVVGDLPSMQAEADSVI